MNMLLWLMIRLYARMLRFYPAHFRDAFAEEMTAVFIEALSAIEQKGWLSLLIWCGREFTSLVTAIMREQWHSLRQEKAVMNPILPANYVHDADIARAETPLAIIAGIFPFILFGLMFTLKEVDYHMPLHWLIHGFVGDRIVHIILLVGLGIGWALRFPRWSYAYLGVVVMTSSWLAVTATPGFHLFGYTFGREQWGWRAWVPLLVLTAVMLLFTRSLQPLAQLFHLRCAQSNRFSPD